MIRHTALNTLKAAAYIQNSAADGEQHKMAAPNARKMNSSADDTTNKASIAALVKIACNGSNSATLRDMACERLGERVSNAPQFAAFAARELFAKRDAGAPPENVFDALIHVIREARITTGTTFGDAVDAVCETETESRVEATSKVLLALRIRGLCSAHAAA